MQALHKAKISAAYRAHGRLTAEAAAHIGRHNADTVARHPEKIGKKVAQDTGDLCRRGQGQRAPARDRLLT